MLRFKQVSQEMRGATRLSGRSFLRLALLAGQNTRFADFTRLPCKLVLS